MKAHIPEQLPPEIVEAQLLIASGSAAALAAVNGVALGAHTIARHAVATYVAAIEEATDYDTLRPAVDELVQYLKGSAGKLANFGANPTPKQEDNHA